MKLLKTSLFLVFLVVIYLWACKRKDPNADFLAEQLARNEREIQNYIAQKGLQMQKDENGIYYQIFGTPQSRTPDTTFRHVIIKYETRLIPSETPIDTNYKLSGNKTLTFALLNPTGNSRTLIIPRGIDIFLQLGKAKMFKGQKAILLMNHTMGYGTASSPFLPPYSAIRVDLELVDVKSETEFIAEKIAELNLPVTQNKDGVIFSLTQPGALDLIRDSSNVTVKYVGRRVINDAIFDSNQSFTFKPIGNVISGWRVGIPLMKKGEKGYLFIPSNQAYRGTGSTNTSGAFVVFPYDPIYFEIEILNVTND
ncbi:MAG: FKBP-type peptidyl-prolyl cis-trans isomerase [Raineya sp.]|nr:FKBP-type peptidyl-prolyl cis-trans isomerase [Raineya sp.]